MREVGMNKGIKGFSAGVAEEIGYYVYRLIDPRNGHTFYVGKGYGDRVFVHMKNAVNAGKGENKESLKTEIISDIIEHGLKPLHIIHRHGIKDVETAHAIEAAVIDAFPNLTNEATGHGSNRFGPATAEQLNERHAPDSIPTDRPVVVIKITRRAIDKNDGDIYKTVRAAWKMSDRRLNTVNSNAHHVLAVCNKICIGVYAVPADGWKPNPGRSRFEFDGKEADDETIDRYVRKVFDSTSQWPVRVFGF